MAAPTNVRVRLFFDYPPPAIPESCMFLLLVDVKRCRVVTDLGSIIRERFFYGQRGGLSLYVDDCLLPPGESIQVIRDNDSIRVKWDEVYPEDEFETRNHILSPPKKSRKRHRKKSIEETEDSEIKPKKQKTDYSEEYLNSLSDHIVNSRRKNKKKRKKERCLLDNCVENEIHRKSIKGILDEEDETKKNKKLTISEEQPAGKCSRKSLTLGASKTNSNLKAKKTRKESSSSDSSEEATAVHKNQLKASPALTKIQTKPISNITVKKSLNSASPVNSKKKESSSSSLDSSEEDDVNIVKKKNVAADSLCSPNVVKKVQGEDVNKEREVGIHKEHNSLKQPDLSAKVTKKNVSTSSEDSDSTSESDHESTTVHKKLSNVSSAAAAKKPDKSSSSLAVKKSLLPTTNHAAKADKRKNKDSSSFCSDSSEENSEHVNTSKSRLIADSLNSVLSQKKKQSDSSDSDTLVIKKSSASSFVSGLVPDSAANGKPSASDVVQGPSLDPRVWGRGVGRGRGRGDNSPWRGRGFRGRGNGTNPGRGRGENPQLSYNTEIQKEQQLNESATNKSVIIENPPVIPKKDYSTLPLLAAPPQVGKLIAFKLLELTENYTPEVSDYKEGKILSYDPLTKQLEVKIFSNESVLKEPGKFDLVYQMAGGRNIVEYAVQQDSRITQRWDSLIEPRLILDSVPEEALSTPQTVNTGL